jgi:hypothetical protein
MVVLAPKTALTAVLLIALGSPVFTKPHLVRRSISTNPEDLDGMF